MKWFAAHHDQFKPGFRDLRWGDPVAPGMMLTRSNGHEKLYVRPTDHLKLGEAKLTSVTYRFYRGCLHGVTVNVASESFREALQALKLVYGTPLQPNPLVDKFFWFNLGNGSNATKAMYERDRIGAGVLIVFSKYLVERREVEETRSRATADTFR